FIPGPADVLRALAGHVRSGGVVAFHEPQWGPWLRMLEPLPLHLACALLLRDVFHGSSVVTEMGTSLYSIYHDAGLPPPTMRLEMVLEAGPKYTQWLFDLFVTVQPRIEALGLSTQKLGDPATLCDRMLAEARAANAVVPCVALIGVWSRKPLD